MLRRFVLLSAIALAVAGTVSRAQVPDWTPPAGIPAPPFGIRETAPADPSPWTTPTTGFYYVDATSAASTDSSNTLGTPDKPRKTIPLTLPAGAVVEVRGTYSVNHRSPNVLTMNGTATAPVFIRGKSASERTAATQPWELHGSYFIVENFDFTIDRQFLLVAPILRGVLRNSTLHGSLTGGGVAIGGGASSIATEVVLFRNRISDNGNITSTVDEDDHGLAIASYVNRIWVLENEIARNSGSGIQVNAGSLDLQAQTQFVYIGRNNIYQTRQAGVGIKQSTDVIVSENYLHDIIDTSWSPAKCLGFQYAPERVWFINNHCHNAVFGIYSGSDSGLGSGQYSFVIGNTVHAIHAPGGAFNPNTSWSNAGIMLAGGIHKVVMNNTIYDVDNGIQTPASGDIVIVNNVVANISSVGHHVFVESGTTAAASTIHHNLFAGPVRIKWGSGTVYDLSSFQATFGKGQSSINADPLFTAAGSDDFTVLAQSPAIDHGSAEAIYDAFKSLYGLDIAMDALHNPRPLGAAWDIGAFEGGGAVRPRAPTNLRIIR